MRSVGLYHSKVYAGIAGFNIQYETLRAETLSPWNLAKLRKNYSPLYRHREKVLTTHGTFFYVTHDPEIYLIALMRNPLFNSEDCSALTKYLLTKQSVPFAMETLVLHKDITAEDINSLLASPQATDSMLTRVAASGNLAESTIALIIQSGCASALQNLMNNACISDEHKAEAALAHMAYMESGRFR